MDLCDVDIYDDLDEFAEKEEKKANEYAELEKKLNEAMRQIEFLNAEKKDLLKKIKIMEINFQSLLDTAKTEIKRKDKVIQDLNKEKDDICFRRKRPKIDDNKPSNPPSDSFKNFQEQNRKSDHHKDFGKYKRQQRQDDHIPHELKDSSRSSRNKHNESKSSQADNRDKIHKERSSSPYYGKKNRNSSETNIHSKLSDSEKEREKTRIPKILTDGQCNQVTEAIREPSYNTRFRCSDQQNYTFRNDRKRESSSSLTKDCEDKTKTDKKLSSQKNVCVDKTKTDRKLNESKFVSSQKISKKLEIEKQAHKPISSSSNHYDNGNLLDKERKKLTMTDSNCSLNANNIHNSEQNIIENDETWKLITKKSSEKSLVGDRLNKQENNYNKTEDKINGFTYAEPGKSFSYNKTGNDSNDLKEKILNTTDPETDCTATYNADIFGENEKPSSLPNKMNLNVTNIVENNESQKGNKQFNSNMIKRNQNRIECDDNTNECKNINEENIMEVDDLDQKSNNNKNSRDEETLMEKENDKTKTDSEICCLHLSPSPIRPICGSAETPKRSPDEIDKRLRTMFQSPPHSTSNSPLPNNTTFFTTLNDHLTIEETDAEISVGQKNALNAEYEHTVNTSCSKSISLGSSDYRFEKISENAVKLYVKRKRISRKRENT